MTATDFEQFDILFAADEMNMRDLRAEFGSVANNVQLMTAYSQQYAGQGVPDPYYGGDEGFTHVYEMLNESITAWLETLDGKSQKT